MFHCMDSDPFLLLFFVTFNFLLIMCSLEISHVIVTTIIVAVHSRDFSHLFLLSNHKWFVAQCELVVVCTWATKYLSQNVTSVLQG